MSRGAVGDGDGGAPGVRSVSLSAGMIVPVESVESAVRGGGLDAEARVAECVPDLGPTLFLLVRRGRGRGGRDVDWAEVNWEEGRCDEGDDGVETEGARSGVREE